MTKTDLLGLEYVLLFGLPGNKLEIIDGRTRCSCPFLDRETAETHYRHWLEMLCQWKGIENLPAIRETEECWEADVAGFKCELYPLPVNIRVPFNMDAFDQILHTYWWRDLWDQQPQGLEIGWGRFLDHQDVSLNLWSLFRRLADQIGGRSAGRTEIVLTDRSAVAPDVYLYSDSSKNNMIDGDYFQGPPHVIAEVLSPPSHVFDRGPRMNLYRQAGVPHLWNVDTDLETIEIHKLSDGEFQLSSTHSPGDSFAPSWCPDEIINVDDIFKTQCKRDKDDYFRRSPMSRVGICKVGEPHVLPEAVPHWLCDPNLRMGLEYLFLLGHPDRRWEIWNNRAACVLAFGSDEEARLRFVHFLEDIGRWEQVATPKSTSLTKTEEVAEIGRFRLTRQSHRVHLDVAVDGRKYRKLLEVWSKREAWDWGQED